MKRKWLLIPMIAVLAIGVFVMVFGRGRVPVEIETHGTLRDEDAASIESIVKRGMRRPFWPYFSRNYVKNLPGAIKRYGETKLYTFISYPEDDVVIVFAWQNTNGLTRTIDSSKSNSFPRVDLHVPSFYYLPITNASLFLSDPRIESLEGSRPGKLTGQKCHPPALTRANSIVPSRYS